jgi:osmotically-inducible protein OsmY
MQQSLRVNMPFKNRAATIFACLTAVLCGGGVTGGLAADGGVAADSTATTSAAPNVYSIPDADLRDSVQFALHRDPYFYDGHVEVSVNHGVVHLRGLVFSDWDLRDAMRIASKAAGDRPVINNLTIVEGGRR